MKKVLIVNLDQEDRAAYSAMVAASLHQVNSETKISLLCSSGEKVLKSIGIFDNIFETGSNDINEKSLKKKHPQLFKQRWDFIINHSSEISSAALISMFESEEYIGPVLNDQKIGQDLIHQSFSSYMLTEMNGRCAPCHISRLYFDIVNLHFDGQKLPSIWNHSALNELAGKFDELRANFLKKRMVLVDSGISRVDNLSHLNLLIQLVKTLDSSTHYHPVLFSKSVDDDSFIINKIKEAVSEELTIASVSDEGILGLLESVDMVITDDLRLKSYSDLVQTPSLFLNRKADLPAMDFSMNPRSVLYNCKELNSKSPDALLQICKYIFEDISENKLGAMNELYKTMIHGNEVILAPLSENTGDDYYKWALCHRFLSHLEKQTFSELNFNESSYRAIISSQKDAIRNTFNVLLEKAKTKDEFEAIDSDSEILLLALDYLHYQGKERTESLKKFLTKTKPVIQELMNFLNSEEARFSQKSISLTE